MWVRSTPTPGKCRTNEFHGFVFSLCSICVWYVSSSQYIPRAKKQQQFTQEHQKHHSVCSKTVQKRWQNFWRTLMFIGQRSHVDHELESRVGGYFDNTLYKYSINILQYYVLNINSDYNCQFLFSHLPSIAKSCLTFVTSLRWCKALGPMLQGGRRRKYCPQSTQAFGTRSKTHGRLCWVDQCALVKCMCNPKQ